MRIVTILALTLLQSISSIGPYNHQTSIINPPTVTSNKLPSSYYQLPSQRYFLRRHHPSSYVKPYDSSSAFNAPYAQAPQYVQTSQNVQPAQYSQVPKYVSPPLYPKYVQVPSYPIARYVQPAMPVLYVTPPPPVYMTPPPIFYITPPPTYPTPPPTYPTPPPTYPTPPPKPKCFVNEFGYKCCSTALLKAIKGLMSDTKNQKKWKNCNMVKQATDMQRDVERLFGRSFETIISPTEIANKGRYMGNFMCKAKSPDGKIVLIYASPNQHFIGSNSSSPLSDENIRERGGSDEDRKITEMSM